MEKKTLFVVARLRYMSLVLKVVNPQQRSWCVLHLLVSEESVVAVQRVVGTVSLG
jgi:hypothetical protein